MRSCHGTDHPALHFPGSNLSVLDQPPDRDALRRRANDFTVDHAVDQYEALLDQS